MSIVSIERILVPKQIGVFSSKITHSLNSLQRRLVYRHGELDFLKKPVPVILNNQELDNLQNNTSLSPSTYQAALALADQYNDPIISGETRQLVNESLDRRLELQRIGLLGVSLLGFLFPMVALQQPIEHLIPAYVAATALYISTACINMWKNRNNAGEADVKLAKKMTGLSLIDKSILNKQSENNFNPESLRAAINTEFIQELWGLGPELALVIAISITGHPMVAIANLGVIGAFKGVRSIVQKTQSSDDQLHREVPQMVVSVIMRNLLNVVAIYASHFMSTPELVAALTIAATQIAASEIVAAAYQTQKPGSAAIYKVLNEELAHTIKHNLEPNVMDKINFYQKHPKLEENTRLLFNIFQQALSLPDFKKKYQVLDLFADLMKLTYVPQLRELEEAYHSNDQFIEDLKASQIEVGKINKTHSELANQIKEKERIIMFITNQLAISENQINQVAKRKAINEKKSLTSLHKRAGVILKAQEYFKSAYGVDMGFTVDKFGLLMIPDKSYYMQFSPKIRAKIGGLLKYLGDTTIFEQPVQVIFPDNQHFFKEKPKINVSIVPPHGACTNGCIICQPTAIRDHGDPADGLLLKRRYSTDEYINQVRNILELGIDIDEIVISGLGEPLLYTNDVVNFIKRAKAEFKDLNIPIRLNTNGQADINTKKSARSVAKELADAGLDTIAISLNAITKKDYEEICQPKHQGAFESVMRFIKECVKDGRMKVLLSFVDYSEQEPQWPKIERDEIVKFANKKFELGKESILIRPYMH